MKSPFPNPLELTVASALLLLSATPPSICPPPPKRCFEGDSVKELRKVKEEERSVSAESKFSGSSSLTSNGSTANNRELQLRRLNLQVVRKSRSKVCVISDGCWSTTSGSTAAAPSASDLTEVSSMSISSSAASSSARSRYVTNQPKRDVSRDEHKRKHIGSTHMRRKAQSILKLLSGGSSSEVKIRQLLGDSPDTSKALRMLLKRDEIRRYGNGGRIDPYVYTVNALHSQYIDQK